MPTPIPPDPRWTYLRARLNPPSFIHLADNPTTVLAAYKSGVLSASCVLWDSLNLVGEDNHNSNYKLKSSEIVDRIRYHFKNLRDLHLEDASIPPPAPTP